MLLHIHEFIPQAGYCYQMASQLDPKDRRWPYYQAIHLAKENPESAIPLLQRAIELSWDEGIDPRLRLAETLLALNRTGEAEKFFRQVLRVQPYNQPAHLGMGKLCVARRDFKSSLPYLQSATAGPETRKHAYQLLGIVYSRLGSEKEAARAQQQAKHLPDDAPRFDKLLHELEKHAVGRQYRLRYVEHLLNLKRQREAALVLRDLVRKYPDDGRVHFWLGNVLGGQKKYDEARQAFQTALRKNPKMIRPLYGLGFIAMLEGEAALGGKDSAQAAFKKLSEAAGYFDKVTRLKPDHALAHYRLGYCYELQHKEAAALQAYRTALRCKPEDGRTHVKVAGLLLQRGRDAEALVHIQYAISYTPDLTADTRPLQMLARVVGRTLLWK
jgi:tetratricopeptide (TPR) repeat protein